jgi:hypothetical protein
MVDLGGIFWRGPVGAIGMMIVLVAVVLPVLAAEPVLVGPRWQVEFPQAGGGGVVESGAVVCAHGALWVAILPPLGEVKGPVLRQGGREVSARMAGYDPVSRLCFLKPEQPVSAGAVGWCEAVANPNGQALRANGAGGAIRGRTNGWVKQIGKNILPLALLRVNFDRAVPPTGTPLYDDDGKVAALVFQASGNGNTGYALPAEAVHRVAKDVSAHGRMQRGWLGLTLLSENPTARIVRVLGGSPAALAGVRPEDVVVAIGDRPVSDYPDAVNAFFYVVPDEPVKLRLLRGVDEIEFTLKPTRAKPE